MEGLCKVARIPDSSTRRKSLARRISDHSILLPLSSKEKLFRGRRGDDDVDNAVHEEWGKGGSRRPAG